MKTIFRGAAWLNLLPGAIVCLVAPVGLLRSMGVELDASAPFFARYLGVAYAALFLANAVAASRPSIWKPVVVLDLVLYGGSALVPLSLYLQSHTLGWFWWANLALDAAMFGLVAGAAIRTFWMK